MFPYFLCHTAKRPKPPSLVYLRAPVLLRGMVPNFSVTLYRGVVYGCPSSCAEPVPYHSSACLVYVKYLVPTAGLIQ